MRNFRFLIIVMFSCSFAFAQQDLGIVGPNNWLYGWTSFKPLTNDYPQTTKILPNVISADFKLSAFETYSLIGEVYVTNNATLTIEAGTTIRASADEYSTLIITKGSKLIAEGLPNNPIVFTSSRSAQERKPGDWGGIYILGSAPINIYGGVYKIESSIDPNLIIGGGTNPADNSGSIKNIRVEFAGKGKNRNGIYDALTFIGVGTGTVIEGIQSSFSNGNSFKFVGGNVKGTKLIAYRSKNSDFELTQGVSCDLSNGLIIRYAFFSASTSFRAVTIKQYENKDMTDMTKPPTNVLMTNFSMINESDGEAVTAGLIKEAVLINDGCFFSLNKSIISGFETALLLSSNLELKPENINKIKLKKIFFNNCENNITSELGATESQDLESMYAAAIYGNVYYKAKATDIFNDPNNDRTPDYRIKISGVK
ncbi:hypothetical protein ACFSX9_07325 [Flavobacterium ardleyense]|uniref:T9SS C-terminal target domain-containing protein n=1 Tax=Flavobacterium ardleyense TaxID=2038737 RepID=A0ABW5Z7Q9_9FLAO